eukprot:gnl/MRDRNA2_/MRDRNA2_85896_c0_seq1.p1 gnl/MRDRNA2_/MRDRNA2_85896_c0~~gnl/MRDRNA2_/MRDRNA2_85896_c0_seq1.p1  ORF type:complete len:360 (-),score=48.27 gnl/MRDRNA2_/MRDRNA2_85896_c0_seq1:75-1154(-)
MDEPLMESIAASARAKIKEFMAKSHNMREIFDMTTDLLSLAWSLGLAEALPPEVHWLLKSHVTSFGLRMDVMAAAAELKAGDEDLLEARAPEVPFAEVNLPGIMVIFKPENWEVNRGGPFYARPDVEWRLLSDWVAEVLPQRVYPLVHSSEYDFGFIHRLDVPSSGLILAAKNFAGLALLRWQLDTRELGREYVVVCHNSFDCRCCMINARISTHSTMEKSQANVAGVPALTWVTAVAYAYPHLDPDVTCTLLGIKINTGRHHQIRAHLTHKESCTVGDGRYNTRHVLLQDDHVYGDMVWFEAFFGRPVVPLFNESGPNFKTAPIDETGRPSLPWWAYHKQLEAEAAAASAQQGEVTNG